MGLAEQVMKLASDAARLAGELLPQRDLLRELVERMQHHDVRVTHAGHALFASSATAFAGADPFRVEDLILRTLGTTLEVEYSGDLRWLALNTKIPNGSDLVLTVDLDMTPANAVAAFIRCRDDDGKHVDGPRAILGSGHVATDRYVQHPVMKTKEFSSQLFITFDHFSRALIRKVALAFAAR